MEKVFPIALSRWAMSRFLSEKLQNLQGYTPGEQPKQGEFIKLNTNENPYPPSPKVEEILAVKSRELQLYCDNTCGELVKTFAKYKNIKEENLLFANGSDEILAFCFMAFTSPNIPVCFPEISYGFYQVFADLFGANAEKIPLNEDLSIQTSDYFQKNKTIIIANPNAPTSLALGLSQIENIVQENPNNVVIIDEAYVDFGGESACELTKQYENLLVCGTFSKSRNLAGARLGYIIGHEDLISDLNKVKYSFNPYNVNTLTQALGVASIEEEEYFQKCCQTIIKTREDFVGEIEKLGFQSLMSKTNFIFTKHHTISGKDVFSSLKERHILVRHFENPTISDYVRITIGSEKEMEIVLKNLKEMVG